MKATFGVLLLCLAYACSAAVDNKTPELEKLIKEQKVVVEGIRKGLIDIKQKLSKDEQVKLNENKKEAKKDIKTIIDAGHKDIVERYEVTSKRDSKEVKECFKTAEVKFVAIEKKVNEILDVCYRQATVFSESSLKNLLHLAEEAKTAITDLDAIIPKCKDADDAKMQKCVETELSQMKSNTIFQFRIEAALAKNKAKESVVGSVRHGKVCKIAVFNTAQHEVFGVEGIRSNAALCIWIAEPPRDTSA